MRSFIGVELTEGARLQCIKAQKFLDSPDIRANWTYAENLHVTLSFLGEVEDMVSLKERLSTVKFEPFEASLEKAGVFPGEGYIEVLWLGIRGPFFALHNQILEAIGKRPDRKYHPHVTLARVKQVTNKIELIKKLKSVHVAPEKFTVEKFVLLGAELTRNGPAYTVLAEFPQSL